MCAAREKEGTIRRITVDYDRRAVIAQKGALDLGEALAVRKLKQEAKPKEAVRAEGPSNIKCLAWRRKGKRK